MDNDSKPWPGFKPGPIGWSPDKPPPGNSALLASGMNIVSRDPPLIGINFGMPIEALWVDADKAITAANAMRGLVRDTFGDLPYNVQGLPIKISINSEPGRIRCDMPGRLSILIANPEVFLAWAQRLEEAVVLITPSA